jgi:uncharacterized protein YjbJ (UPF0337 family)
MGKASEQNGLAGDQRQVQRKGKKLQMTPEQETRYAEIKQKMKLASDRLQRIVNALGNAAILRELGVRPLQDDATTD